MDPLTNEDMRRQPLNHHLPHAEFFPSNPAFSKSNQDTIKEVYDALRSQRLYVQDSGSGQWQLENVKVMGLHNMIENPTSEEQWATLFNQVSKGYTTNCLSDFDV